MTMSLFDHTRLHTHTSVISRFTLSTKIKKCIHADHTHHFNRLSGPPQAVALASAPGSASVKVDPLHDNKRQDSSQPLLSLSFSLLLAFEYLILGFIYPERRRRVLRARERSSWLCFVLHTRVYFSHLSRLFQPRLKAGSNTVAY